MFGVDSTAVYPMPQNGSGIGGAVRLHCIVAQRGDLLGFDDEDDGAGIDL
jgi:hypothetical protein